jgi:competence protein ComEC
VLRISGAGARVLLPGDIPASVEQVLALLPDFGPLDLVVAAHHGSRTSSSLSFVAATRPRFVVFSTGFRNRWHFPASEVLERWRGSGACALDTGELGALQFAVSPGSTLRLVSAQRQVAGGLWLARPDAAAPCQ